jgi:hypothetical protein
MTTRKWERIESRKRHSNYPSFEKSLDLHFGDEPPKNKEQLNRLMKDYAFRVSSIKGIQEKVEPTDKQLNYAWNYIKSKYFPYQPHIEDYYRIETYGFYVKTRKPRYIYRATKNIEINNKKYRKGQFIPRRNNE